MLQVARKKKFGLGKLMDTKVIQIQELRIFNRNLIRSLITFISCTHANYQVYKNVLKY